MSSNLKVNTILPSTGTTVTVSGISSVTSSISAGSSITGTTFYGSGANLTSLPSQVTINNNAANRVITGEGGTTLNGEANLTFDGTNFSVTGAANIAGTLILQPGGTAWSTTNTRPQLGRQADGELRLGAGSDSASNVTFYTSPSAGGTLAERLRITSAGLHKISQPGNMQDGTYYSTITISSPNGVWQGLRFDRGTTAKWRIGMKNDDTFQIANLFLNGSSGVDDNTLRITDNNNISITGNLAFASGKGIDFSATSDSGGMTSELLDDYEEGSFTPYFRGAGSAGSYGYSRQVGRYTKIGQRVFFNLYLTLNAISANASGNLMIYGLPYTSEGGNTYSFAGVAYYYGFNGITPQSGLIDISNTRLYLYQNNATSEIVNSTAAGALTTTSSIIMGGQYSVG